MRTQNTLATALVAALVTALPSRGDVDWSKYTESFTIKFPGYSGTETLTDFPVLIRVSKTLNSFRYADCKVSGGGDLRFADASGNLLPSEVEKWDPSGESLVWVKVPTLTKDTVITAHYGCATPDAVTTTQVWDSHYLGVWHMGAEQGTTTQSDSTANGKDFGIETAYADGVAVGTNGVAGRAAAFHQREDGKGCYSQTDSNGDFAGFTAFTIEVWTYQDNHDVGSITGDRCVLKKGPSTPTWQIYETKNDGRIQMSFKTNETSKSIYINAANSNANKPVRAEWNHFAYTFDSASGTRDIYLNGTSRQSYASLAANVVTMSSNANSLYLGGQQLNNSACFPGTIDEVRISNIARSADWVKATHDTIRPDSGFASYEVANDWAKYRQCFTMTFDGVETGATLTNFPVLVRLSENSPEGFHYADCKKPNGGDLRFRFPGGELLPSEVEQWNPNGESLVWVKVPTLTRGTHITAYYGWSLAPSVDSTQVWDSHFLGVWHMGAAAGETSQTDATGGGTTLADNDTTPGGVAAGATGIAGLAMQSHVRSDGKGGYRFSDSGDKFGGMSAATFEFWAWQDDHDPGTAGDDNRYILGRASTSGTAWSLYENKSGNSFGSSLRGASKSAYLSSSSATPPARAFWNHGALVYDGTDGDMAYYLNGSLSSTLVNATYKANVTGSLTTSYRSLVIGNYRVDTGVSSSFPGLIDEVRISDTARSAAWLKATHDTIRPGTGFATLSAAEKNASAFVLIVR